MPVPKYRIRRNLFDFNDRHGLKSRLVRLIRGGFRNQHEFGRYVAIDRDIVVARFTCWHVRRRVMMVRVPAMRMAVTVRMTMFACMEMRFGRMFFLLRWSHSLMRMRHRGQLTGQQSKYSNKRKAMLEHDH